MAEQYPKDVIERAAKRLFAIAEDPDIAPGVYDLDFYRERVAADPKDYVTHDDFMRCEYFAEAGEQYAARMECQLATNLSPTWSGSRCRRKTVGSG